MTHILPRYAAFAIDLDGVIWRGSQFLPGAADLIRSIQEAGKPFLLLTNNSSYEPAQVSERLTSINVVIDTEQVLNTSRVAASWISSHGLEGSTAFILGDPSVARQLSHVVTPLPIKRGLSPRIVFVARDSSFDYVRLAAASDAVRGGAALLAANRDHVLPVEDGFEPGTGAILAAIETASQSVAIVLGKPELPMMSQAREVLGQNVLMIGDREDSDIAGAAAVGWDSALIRTGVDARGDESAATFIFDSLNALLGQ